MENLKNIIESLKLKFTSGNNIPVERSTILRKEYEIILPILEEKLKRIEFENALDNVFEEIDNLTDEEFESELDKYKNDSIFDFKDEFFRGLNYV